MNYPVANIIIHFTLRVKIFLAVLRAFEGHNTVFSRQNRGQVVERATFTLTGVLI
jgi:hypothetical protein